MKNKIIAVFITLLIVFSLTSCNVNHRSYEGFENWSSGLSSIGLDGFLVRDFFTEYPYQDGNFYYDDSYSGFIPFFSSSWVEKSFIWLVYDDAGIYLNAKQFCFDYHSEKKNVLDNSFDGTEAFDFTFYIFSDFHSPMIGDGESQFPDNFIAFGLNDETKTLVFVGFNGLGKKEQAYIKLVETDFSSFLTHYYGDWFDWEAGVGYTASETTAD